MGGIWSSKKKPIPAATSSSAPPWSELPPEILDLVLRRLDSHVDRVSFASVCRLWRHVARRYSPPLPPAMPWIIFPHGVYFQSLSDGEVRRFLRRREHDDYQCHGSFDQNWLFFKEIGSNRLFLENPLTTATIELPGHCNEPVFLFSNGTFQTPSNLTSANFDIYKVVVCSDDLIAALVKYDYHNVVVCCRPGMLSWSTGISKTTNVYRYQDMAFYNGMVYAVSNGGDLFEHEVSKDSDTGEPGVSRIKQVMAAPPPLDGYYQFLMESTKCYLVISCANKLLLVRWFLPNTIENPNNNLMLKVSEADFEASEWIEVERLDDQVLFVSSNCSKAISTASTHDQDLEDNRIYAIDDDIVFWHYWQGRDSCTCMYDMSSKTMHPISLGERMISRSEAAWFFP
ncbi:hypothetical protein HU200_008428 [Digitaria exilis]|uniref:F-box domain-containing protein n=1 Tax=Digitaria exilis TaxID=1010633 RepID=A0A835FNV8_9POAL|nr:hypothetical protein HU200_008428 [Digitaria exilis]